MGARVLINETWYNARCQIDSNLVAGAINDHGIAGCARNREVLLKLEIDLIRAAVLDQPLLHG